MKLISLNTWGGAAGHEGILDFFAAHKGIDIFCLQEVWNGGEHIRGKILGGVLYDRFIAELYENIGMVLNKHRGYFYPHYGDWFGLAIFVKKEIKVIEEGEIFVFKSKEHSLEEDVTNHARNVQYVAIETSKGMRTVANFHGLWNGKGKTDSDERLLQSDNIIRFLKDVSNPYVLCGDFNLRPDTVSLKKLEDSGMRNLIKEYGITSTRSSFYKKPERFADYAFVSDGIKVNEFKILPDEVSDHLAMYLDFE